MKFYYLVAAYNEEPILRKCIEELSLLPKRFPGSEALLLNNGSQDNSWPLMQQLVQENPGWLSCYNEEGKGLGLAFKRGLRELQKRKLDPDSWIVFAAADLPFGWSDLESFLKFAPEEQKKHLLFVGSKRHPQSQANRNWRRVLGSWIFEFSRFVFLGIKTKDTQGALFLRADGVSLVEKLQADDYFFSVELVYFAEKQGLVSEMPITLSPERRQSKVSILKDGWKSLQQLWHFRRRL